MRHLCIRFGVFIVLGIIAGLFLAPSVVSAGHCVSSGSGQWIGGFHCDGVPDQTPTSSDTVEILTGHSIVADDPTQVATLSIGNDAVLVITSTSLSVHGDLTVQGSLDGPDSTLYAYGSIATYAGSFLGIDDVYLGNSGTQTITGAGSWISTGALTIGHSSSTVLDGDVNMAFSQYLVYGSFALAGFNLTFNPLNALVFDNYGTFAIGSQLLIFGAPGDAVYTNYGVTSGSGSFRIDGTTSVSLGNTFEPSIEVDSGTTNLSGVVHNSLTVRADATVEVIGGLSVVGDVTVHGELSGVNAFFGFSGDVTVNGALGGPNTTLDFTGSSFTNNGSSITVDDVNFWGQGAQTISGTGPWLGTGRFHIDWDSQVVFGSGVSMAFGEYEVRGSLSLVGHSLAFESPTTLAFTNWGTFNIGDQTLVFAAPSGASFFNYGSIIGTGTFITNGSVSLFSNGAFEPLLEIASGTATAYSTIQGALRAITVQQSAMLKIPPFYGVFVSDIMTVDGILSCGDTMSFVYFSGAGPKTIGGTGSWACDGRLYVATGSQVTMTSDLSLGFRQYQVDGVLSLNDYMLTLNPLSTLSFLNYGTLDIGNKLLAFNAPSGAFFYSSNGITTGSGTFRTTGTVSLSAFGGSFHPSVDIAAGITSIRGSFHGPIDVQAGATLEVAPGYELQAYGDVTIEGTVNSGTGGSLLRFYGSSFTNNSSAMTVTAVYFAGSSQSLQGVGSLSGNVVAVFPDASVDLDSDHTMRNLIVLEQGSFSLDSHTLCVYNR